MDERGDDGRFEGADLVALAERLLLHLGYQCLLARQSTKAKGNEAAAASAAASGSPVCSVDASLPAQGNGRESAGDGG